MPKSTAAEVLERCKRRGVELYLDDGAIRYRAHAGAYGDHLRALVAECREELTVTLALRSRMVCAACGAADRTVYLTTADGSNLCHRCWRGDVAV